MALDFDASVVGLVSQPFWLCWTGTPRTVRKQVAEKLTVFSEYRSPKPILQLNDYENKVVKIRGESVWHSHQYTDKLFLILSGQLTIQLG
ncbi:hypothetical protein [Mycobacterium riyadhense]|uniref:hypothetical protein n=1 Tax=Mycobacterium riyadhense TaxID=486698 RepID=UPI001EF9D3CE|nr:hypothetical protein [Mycobacterium riyadhense]